MIRCCFIAAQLPFRAITLIHAADAAIAIRWYTAPLLLLLLIIDPHIADTSAFSLVRYTTALLPLIFCWFINCHAGVRSAFAAEGSRLFRRRLAAICCHYADCWPRQPLFTFATLFARQRCQLSQPFAAARHFQQAAASFSLSSCRRHCPPLSATAIARHLPPLLLRLPLRYASCRQLLPLLPTLKLLLPLITILPCCHVSYIIAAWYCSIMLFVDIDIYIMLLFICHDMLRCYILFYICSCPSAHHAIVCDSICSKQHMFYMLRRAAACA